MKALWLAALGSLALFSASPMLSDPLSVAVQQQLPDGDCVPHHNPLGQEGVDCHAWEGKEFTSLTPSIKVIEHKSYQDLEASFERQYHQKTPDGYKLYGYVYWDSRYCQVHVIDPDVDYRPEVVGHEFLHCVHGHWHNHNDYGIG